MKSNRYENRKRKRMHFRRSISILLTISLAFSGTFFMGERDFMSTDVSPVKAAAAEQSADDTTEGSTGGITEGSTDSENTTDFTYSVNQNADDGTEEAVITGYAGTDGKLVIPKNLTVDGREIPVTKITAFKKDEKDKLTSLTIEDGAEIEIAQKAFEGSANLKTVSLPSGTTFGVKKKDASTIIHYGNNFANCTSLTELTLGDGISVLPEYIFEGCTALKSVRLPSGLECFENCAFAGCTALETLEIPEGVQEIGRNGFEGCTSLTKVAIPTSIQRWCISEHLEYSNHAQNKNGAFSGCTSLSEVTLPEGLTVMGCESFDATALTSVTVPSTVKVLNYTFYNCETLEEVILQEGALESIGRNAFANCKLLKAIDIPPTVTQLGESPFLGCESLKMLVIPPSVTTFDGNVYFDSGCTSLEKVFVLAEEIEVSKSLAYSSSPTVYCPAGSDTYERYKWIQNDGRRLVALTPDMLTTDLLGVTAEAYRGVYDEKGHPLAALKGQGAKDTISYHLLENGNETGEALTTIPEITEPGVYELKISITHMGVEYIKTVQAEISKKIPVLSLEDMTVSEDENWFVTPKEYDGEADTIYYTYYKDEALEQKCSGTPTAAGVYYVQASTEESVHYLPAKSNVAKLEIQKSQKPAPTDNPGIQPTKTPDIKPTKTENPAKTAKPGQKVTVKKVNVKKVKSTKKKTMEIRWNKVSNANGYVIWIGQNKKFTKGKKVYTVKSGKTTKKIIRKLKRNKKYFVKIQAYRIVKGKKYKGKFSSVKSVRVR